MAADNDTFACTLDDFALEVSTLEDGFEKAIAVNEIPYRDGALLQDMGQKARRVRLRCYFYGEGYQKHFDFIEHLKSKAVSQLNHPVYGMTKGMVESVNARHDERIETAEVDITIVEQLRGTTTAPVKPDVKQAALEAQAKGLTEAKDAFIKHGWDSLGGSFGAICSMILNPLRPAFEQFSNLSKAAGAWVKSVDGFVSEVESCLTEIANPANGIISAIDFGLDLPGRVIGSVARLCERYDLMFDSLKSSPEKFSRNFRDAMKDLELTLGLEDPAPIRTVGALQLGASMAAIYAADESSRDTARSLETTASFDEHGNCIKPAAAPVLLDAGQIEQSLASANELIQAAVTASRSAQSLKTMARLLTEHAISIKIEAERLVPYRADEPMPLHLICHRAGLPYNYAERLIKVQTIPNPNECQGDIKVYVH